MIKSVLRGAMAGAAGTAALNAVTYLDMTGRGRPASETPRKTVEQLADATHFTVPGTGEAKENRASAMGALLGIATGVGVGAAYGAVRRLGFRPPWWIGAMITGAAALVGSNVPMTALGVTDPRDWSAVDWTSDVVPHLVFGVVTALATADADRVR